MRFTDTLLESQKVTHRHDMRRQRGLSEVGARSARFQWTREAGNLFSGVDQLCRNIF